jgi:DNA phosphorothioation-associated putative methyltransferase
LSRPVRIAVEDGVIKKKSTIFDYGCGRGGDVKLFNKLGYECNGWDPSHRTAEKCVESDVVNLGYVINVIEDPDERAETIIKAWGLAREILIVSARLIEEESSLQGYKLHSDGVVTNIGTFQKFYSQDTLRNWISQTLNENPVAAAPGVFYVFRNAEGRSAFLEERSRRIHAIRIERAGELYKDHETSLQSIVQFLSIRGRAPAEFELENTEQLQKEFGRLKQAIRVVRLAIGDEQWKEVAVQRADDLVIYLALSQFDSRPKLSEMSLPLQMDIKSFFSTYKNACASADELLSRLGMEGLINIKCMACEVGKMLPGSLYVHVDALGLLPVELRLFEGCAREYIGRVEGATLVKFDRFEPRISYLGYADFDKDPHPKLLFSYSVNLQTFRIKFRYYGDDANRPILHRKEAFIAKDDPRYAKFAKLTKSEERHGLYEKTSRIGYEKEWGDVLQRKGVQIKGHRVVSSS